MIKVVLLILLAEVWGVIGQVFYKKSVNKLETPNLRCIKSYSRFIKSVVTMPTIWVGLFFICIGLGVWLIALAQTDLSIAFPIDSMQYIITLFAARIFLNEKMDKMKIFGTLLVIGGIIVVAMS